MFEAFIFVMGTMCGGICWFVLLMDKQRTLKAKIRKYDADAKQIQEAMRSANSRENAVNERVKSTEAWRKEIEQQIKQRVSEIEAKRDAMERELERRANEIKSQREATENELSRRANEIKRQVVDLERRIIAYKELQAENAILKRDLQNIDVNLHKLQLDGELQRQKQEQLDQRGQELGSRYLKENVKWIGSSLNANNFAACKQRLVDVMARCREIGFEVPAAEEAKLIADLKAEFEKMVRAAFEREEQARIKAQIREEEKLKREVDRELKQLERERVAIQAALDRALAEAKDKHSDEVDRLKARLAEAEAKSQRAMSQAQMTKSGNVYVISNIGAFGDGVFKVGMTRRLEPNDRVRELGDASVPFPFDVHMMVSCDDAPSLENALHRALHKVRLNKLKPRKEYFKTDIETIRKIVEEHHGRVEYVADPEALEYRQSLTMSEEDAEYIESVYDALEDEGEAVADDA
jgi:hypothetical protein